ncbi:hypothetical protein [Nocardia sp. BMG51109]|uniref:hypothetical protein n=1 Tax=Nocardia sp. BMG51109 TaxID=1056816 RepID=UPI000464E0F9|nr:hypothetical protein [Nocardia sp. BMG51109]
MPPVQWSDAADEIIGSDQAVAFGYVTPARGVILTPMTNFGIRERTGGTMTPLNTSVAMWRKLQRLQENPQIAIAYHTRDHSYTERPEYVLVQGRARPTELGTRDWLDRHREAWERFAGPRKVGPLWEWWLRPYHRRVGLDIDVTRVVVWPDLGCDSAPEVYGDALPPLSASQWPPKGGVEPRIRHRRAARHTAARPNRLLSWVGGDGFPVIVPIGVEDTDKQGITLTAPAQAIPPGGRRAGLLAHSFARYTYGQNLRRYTGWLENLDGRITYAPHTAGGHYIPRSRTAYRLGAGYATWRGYLQGRRAGVVPR